MRRIEPTSQIRIFPRIFGVLAVACALLMSHAANADYAPVSTYAFEQALNANSSFNLYTPPKGGGFKLDSSTYSGTGTAAPSQFDDTNQKLYALLIDGRYDFRNDKQPLTLQPYISGGAGMATTGISDGGSSVGTRDMSPMFRVGGGVAYNLGQQWDMSLDYKAGTALVTGDQVFTGRSQQAVDLQSLNLGMHYAF